MASWVTALKAILGLVVVVLVFRLLTQNSCDTPDSVLCTVNKGLNTLVSLAPFAIVGDVVVGFIGAVGGFFGLKRGFKWDGYKPKPRPKPPTPCEGEGCPPDPINPCEEDPLACGEIPPEAAVAKVNPMDGTHVPDAESSSTSPNQQHFPTNPNGNTYM